jgi:hypothetical protein
VTDAFDSPLLGAELVQRGLQDLAESRVTAEALLLSRFPERLASVEVALPTDPLVDPEIRLYTLLSLEHGSGTHGAYNALTHRLMAFMRAAARERSRCRDSQPPPATDQL